MGYNKNNIKYMPNNDLIEKNPDEMNLSKRNVTRLEDGTNVTKTWLDLHLPRDASNLGASEIAIHAEIAPNSSVIHELHISPSGVMSVSQPEVDLLSQHYHNVICQ